MADSTTNLDPIVSSQAAKEVTANAFFDAASTATLFGRRSVTSAALTFGYYGGKYRKADGTITSIANGTVALTASATNYILETNGVVTVVTSAPTGWPSPLAGGAKALYQIVCDGSGPTSYTDYRTTGIGSGAGTGTGTVTSVGLTVPAEFSVAGSPVTTSGTLAVSKANQSANTVWAGPTTGSAAAPAFRTLVQSDLPAQPYDLTGFYPGVPGSSIRLTRVPFARAVTFPANFAGSVAASVVAATGSTAFDVRKNGSSVGTITFAAGATTATFTTAGGAAVSMAAGDHLSIMSPSTADATLADIDFVLAGTR